MKRCSKCNVVKRRDEFSPYRKGKDGLNCRCKECRNADLTKKRREMKENLGCAVYYLPEEHYVGITTDVKDRMSQHRKRGKITERYEIICYCERRVDAHWLETMFHMRGYNGFRKYE